MFVFAKHQLNSLCTHLIFPKKQEYFLIEGILTTIEKKLAEDFTQRGVAVSQSPIQGRGGFFLIADKS